MKLFDRLFPPNPDPLKEAERKHFVFAFVLVFGCMLMLPIGGAIYVMLIQAGVFAKPY